MFENLEEQIDILVKTWKTLTEAIEYIADEIVRIINETFIFNNDVKPGFEYPKKRKKYPIKDQIKPKKYNFYPILRKNEPYMRRNY